MMTTQNNQEIGTSKRPKKGDRIEVVRILVLALVSFVLGFGLVIFFLGPRNEAIDPDMAEALLSEDTEGKAAKVEPAPEGVPPAEGEGYAVKQEENPLMADLGDNSGNAQPDDQSADNSEAPPEVPPGRTPDGVTLDGDAFYLKCWDNEGQESPGSACDPLAVLEKRFSTRLYVVHKCREQHASGKEGKLSLGIEVDFGEDSLSFWNGASSTLENAARIATCLRGELSGLPLHSINHKFSRYRLFFTVVFGKTSEKPSTKEVSKPTRKQPDGKMVNVLMDKVRVRKSPVDGAVIGKINSGNEVKLIGKKGEWCQVLTPNNNEGWMICEALEK